jgi:hypothetical protein
MTGHRLEVVPLEPGHWMVRYEGDSVPLAETSREDEAIAEARNFARQFGEALIVIHERDGRLREEQVDPDYRAPTPRDVKGPAIG